MLYEKKEIMQKIKADSFSEIQAENYHPGLLVLVLVPYIENLPTYKGLKLLTILLKCIQKHKFEDIVLEGYNDTIITYLITLPERLSMEWEDENYYIYIFDKINNRLALNRFIKRGKLELLVLHDRVNVEWIDPINKQCCVDMMLKLNYKLDELPKDPFMVKCLMARCKGMSSLDISYRISSILPELQQEQLKSLFQEYLHYHTDSKVLSDMTDEQIDCFIVVGNSFHKVATCNFVWISSFMSAAMDQLDSTKSYKIQHLINIWYINESNKPNFKVPIDISNKVNELLHLPLKPNKLTKRPPLQLAKGWSPANELQKVLADHKTISDRPRDSDDDSNFDDEELNETDYLEIQPSNKLKKPAFIRQIMEYLNDSEDSFKLQSAYNNILDIINNSDCADLKEVLPRLIELLVKANNSGHLQSFENIHLALEALVVKYPDLACNVLYKLLCNSNISEKARIIDAMVVSSKKLKEDNNYSKHAITFILTLLNSFELKNDLIVIKRYALAVQTLVLFSKDAYMLGIIIVEAINFYVKLCNYDQNDIKKICIKGVDSCFQIVLHSRINMETLIKELPIAELIEFGKIVPEKSLTREMLNLITSED
eukprot:NODE_146_length_17563_cov_0.253321.p2 type:complete len:599 gc:universal NODE_146_length_17563_cov_0.253321:1891-3687(+)